MSFPKISIIMAVYNGEKYLRTAIDSVMQQSFTDFEVIIVDDCSTDDT
ncbi:MAG: glycosyltransferase, partial [Desulfobacteraceae bacterium]|nr:glycosyltransferase [Desulfobacteraceae bacterium]